MTMKTISVVVFTFNEEKNVVPLAEQIIATLNNNLPQYNYELLFIDNHSSDCTQQLITELCEANLNIKAIFNARNFGPNRSSFYGLQQASGDCAILMTSDFQDPVELIPKFVDEWEKGSKIICGQKTSSKENVTIYVLRTLYYKTIRKMSRVEQIDHFTGFALYDRDFLEVIKTINDPEPWLRGIVAEIGYRIKIVQYQQQKRRYGKSKNNFAALYDMAMTSFTSYTKAGLRIATILGFGISFFCLLLAAIYLIIKLTNWDNIPMGVAPMTIGIFFLGGIQVFFIGLVGEYILTMNSRLVKRPLVIEEKRINFD